MPHNIPKIQYKNVTITGTTAITLFTITALADTSALVAGMVAVGAGIPVGAKIVTIDSATQVTLDLASTASASVPIEFYVEIVFTYPPIEPKGEKLDAIERTSTSISGIKQVSVDNIEASRSLNFSFLTEAQKTLLETFFTSHGAYGRAFHYFDDQTSIVYIDYELRDFKFDPKKITAKTANVYVWEVGMTFRRVI